ncbi:MAG: hypothetical protein IKK42_01765 [Oscillospiraceae bacterium]|nr:hypothetical protein [Oscillospiraceae bacterium]
MEHKSNKTEAVMRLLTGKRVVTNPSLGSNLKEEETAPKNTEPMVEQPVAEQPKAEPQVVAQPVAEAPKPEPQVIEQPVVEAPKSEPQIVEQPKPEPQVVEAPKPEPQPTVVEIDVTGELITELMPQVLQRFNCCQCPICYADAVTEAGNRVPTIKVKINGKEDMKMVDKMKDQHRKDVMMTLVRLALERKPLPKHD